MIAAHLNGGPRDDSYMVLEREEYWVPIARYFVPVTENEELPIYELGYAGCYRMRRDAFRQPVPHNLAGVVEFDWDPPKR